MAKPPDHVQWVRYHCGAALMALVAVSPAAELAHRRLCDYHWQTGLWLRTKSGNAAALARVARPRWDDVAEQLLSLGWRSVRGHLVNDQVHRVRRQAVAALKRCRLAGSIGGTAAHARSASSARSTVRSSDPTSAAQATVEPINDKEEHDNTLSGKPVERLTLSGSPPKKSAQSEKAFLDDLREVIGLWNPRAVDPELTNWGGWWRTRYRANPAKARRLLAEVRCLVVEGRVMQSPGKAAVDLWNRLP